MKTVIKVILPVAIGLSLASCGGRANLRGYIFDKELADAIEAGIDNKQSVTQTLGTPTLTAQFTDKTWYYVSTNVKVKPLTRPKAQWRRVMAVSFDDKGVVEKVVNYDLSNARDINPVDEQTPTRGRDMNFFQMLFMNVGRFTGQQQPGAAGGPGPNGS